MKFRNKKIKNQKYISQQKKEENSRKDWIRWMIFFVFAFQMKLNLPGGKKKIREVVDFEGVGGICSQVFTETSYIYHKKGKEGEAERRIKGLS